MLNKTNCVNYYGFYRSTDDLDICVAPTNENKNLFLDTLKCIGYTESEFQEIKNENFSTYLMCSLGSPPNLIDVIAIIHKNLSFDEAEKNTVIHEMQNGIELRLTPYSFLKGMKLQSRREKDLFNIARLQELRNKKK